MKKYYFTALVPASDIDSKIKKIQLENNFKILLPTLAPLEFYDSFIEKKDISVNIDLIQEFSTQEIIYTENWLILKLPTSPLNSQFKIPNMNLFPRNIFGILIGNNIKNIPTINFKPQIIRNWELSFFELIIWNSQQPFDNYELNTLWKIKKKRLKG